MFFTGQVIFLLLLALKGMEGKCFDDFHQRHFEIVDVDKSGALSSNELCTALNLEENSEGCNETFVMLDLTKDNKVDCQGSITI